MCWRMWQMLYHIVLRLCSFCHILPRMLCCPIIFCMSPTSLCTSRIPVHGCSLDTYSWTYTMPDSASTCNEPWFPLIRQKPYEEHQGQDLQDVFHVVHTYDVFPLCPIPTFKNGCPWFSTGHLLLDFYHVRFSHEMHMSHGLPLDTGKHKVHMIKGLSILVWVFGCWTEPYPICVTVGICQCSCLWMNHSLL